jgi:hypothetical protein
MEHHTADFWSGDDLHILEPEEVKILVEHLAQNDPHNFRTGTTSPFPTKREMNRLMKFKNCSAKFASTYRLEAREPLVINRSTHLFALRSLDETERRARMGNRLLDFPLVVKEIPLINADENNPYPNEDALNDVVVGSRLNLLVATNVAPGFMQTVDWFICHKKLDEDFQTPATSLALYVVLQRLDTLLSSYLVQLTRPTIANVTALFGQLLFTLESAQKTYHYTHYDLHPGNVMVVTSQRKVLRAANAWQYKRADGSSLFINPIDCAYLEVCIIDFGTNFINTPVRLFSEYGEKIAGSEMPQRGVRRVFHKQYDMRRYIMTLVHTLIEKTYNRSRNRLWWPFSTSIQLPDFFAKLQFDDPHGYSQLMDMLNHMSGHSEVRIPGEQSPAIEKELDECFQRLELSFELLFPRVIKFKPTKQDVINILLTFREEGMSWYIERLRQKDLVVIDTLLYMWQWTRFTFDATPSSVLDLPLFDRVRIVPPIEVEIAMAGEFQYIELPRHGKMIAEASGGVFAEGACLYCGEEAKLATADNNPAERKLFCSEKCYKSLAETECISTVVN